MSPMSKIHADIIEAWPGGLQALAADMEVPYFRARQWKTRNSIPSKYWARLLDAAPSRRVYVTPEHLLREGRAA